jgi:hypothetical protein
MMVAPHCVVNPRAIDDAEMKSTDGNKKKPGS